MSSVPYIGGFNMLDCPRVLYSENDFLFVFEFYPGSVSDSGNIPLVFVFVNVYSKNIYL